MNRPALCALLALTGAAPAAAQPLPSTYHQVTGVAADDTLTVRDAPSASAGVLGALAPGTAPIEIGATNAEGTWGRIPFQGADGWVSMRYLAPFAPPMLAETSGGRSTGIPIGLGCGGTEPFWDLAMRDDRTVEMSEPALTAPLPLTIERVQVAVGHVGLPAGLGATGAQGTTVSATFRPGYCDDGMSDMTYNMTVDLWYGSDGTGPALLSGCCRLAPQ